MELFYFRYSLMGELGTAARKIGVPEGQPFIIDEQGTPLEDFCREAGIDRGDLANGLCISPTDSEHISLSCAPDINDFFLERTATSKSPNTWKATAEQLCIFLRWTKAQGKNWSEVTLQDLHAFYRTRRLLPSAHTGRPISRKSWNSCVSALSAFYTRAVEIGRLDRVPFTFRKLRFYSTGNTEKNTLTESGSDEPIRYITLEEYKIFREALGKTRNGGRDQTFADTLLNTGLRLSEGNSLSVGQIPDPEAPRYKGVKAIPFAVTGKGGKTRRIRFPKSTLKSIEIYKGEDRSNAIARWEMMASKRKSQTIVEPDALWLTERGTPMSPARWEEIFAEASRRCGIHCTPHMLRHTFAIYTLSALIEKTICSINELRIEGADKYSRLIHNPLRKLAGLLGHNQVATTFLYLDFIEQTESLVDDAIAEWSKKV